MNAVTQICPCCGGSLFDRAIMWFPDGRTLVVGNQAATLSKYHAVMFGMLWTARLRGGAVTKEQFIEALYSDDPAGGPDTADRVVYVELVGLRKILRPMGLDIPTNTGREPIYRLSGR